MKTRNLSILCVLLILGGCATPQELAAQRENQRRAYLAALQQRCNAYGFNAGTNAFADCVRREHMCEQEKARAQMQYGLAMMQESSRPGASALGAMGRAGAQVQPPLCQ